ncbi:hypothetical protein [Rhodococcus sp. NPDC127528]
MNIVDLINAMGRGLTALTGSGSGDAVVGLVSTMATGSSVLAGSS